MSEATSSGERTQIATKTLKLTGTSLVAVGQAGIGQVPQPVEPGSDPLPGYDRDVPASSGSTCGSQAARARVGPQRDACTAGERPLRAGVTRVRSEE